MTIYLHPLFKIKKKKIIDYLEEMRKPLTSFHNTYIL